MPVPLPYQRHLQRSIEHNHVSRHVNEPHPRIRRKRCDVADAACHENVPSRLKPGLGAADFEGRGGEAQHNSSISSFVQRTEEDEKAQLDEEHQRQKREEEDEHSLLLRGICVREWRGVATGV